MFSPILLFTIELGTFSGDVWLAIFMYISVMIFAWAKGTMGDVRAAILFAITIMILIFYQHPDLIWLALGLYLFKTYGKEMFKI